MEQVESRKEMPFNVFRQLKTSNDLFNEKNRFDGIKKSFLIQHFFPPFTARCEERLQIPRANPEILRHIFDQYASIEKDGRKFMTDSDFIRKYLGLYTEENYNRETVRLLASAADTSKDGLISFEEFQAFEASLCAPDALYLTAFEIFDNNASESITAVEFEKVIRHSTALQALDFDFNSEFIKRYFGKNKTRRIDYYAFCHLLTEYVRNNLLAVCRGNSSSHKIKFPFYQAFNSMLSKIELFKRVYIGLARGSLDLKVTKEEFLQATQAYAQITPYEVEIFFHLAELAHPGHRTIDMEDFEKIDPDRLKRVSHMTRLVDLKAVNTKADRGIFTALLESSYRFILGSVAGACGASAVYPIDLVKTRMQNQRSGSFVGAVQYKSYSDCFKKVIRFEGFRGLYRGLPPQIVGVAPEK
uniref:Uncharacterized protein n=1 Tax=Panagrolaimus sp. PS1159 TaxID=55785 RepID=A0AC35GMH6_9BILA